MIFGTIIRKLHALEHTSVRLWASKARFLIADHVSAWVLVGLHRQHILDTLQSCLEHISAHRHAHAHRPTAPATPTSRHRAADDAGGAIRRLRVGLKAGSCEERFACLFQVRAVFSHQVCTDGSVFFRRQLPKAVCRNPYSIFSLFWILPPHSRLGGRIIIYRTQPFQT